MSREEQWMPIPGMPGYEASSEGRIQSFKGLRPRILKAAISTTGYFTVAPSIDGIQRSHGVHRLVLLAFVGPKPDGMVARHLNDIKTDNRLVNLTYGSLVENAQDAIVNGRNWNSSKTHCSNGHEFTDENTLSEANRRQCRRCALQRNAAYRLRLGQTPRVLKNRSAA